MKQFAVIGAGRFGSSVAITLMQKGYSVLVIDSDMEKVQQISDQVTKAVQVDAIDEKAMSAVGIQDFDAVIVGIGRQNMEDSVLVTMMLKELGVKTVVAKAMSEAHGRILSRIGADRVVFPERDMGRRLAESLVTASIMDHLDLVPGYSIAEIKPPKSFIGKTLRESDIKQNYGIQIIAIKGQKPNIDEKGEAIMEEEFNIAPDAAAKIQDDDILLVLGKDDDIDRFKKA